MNLIKVCGLGVNYGGSDFTWCVIYASVVSVKTESFLFTKLLGGWSNDCWTNRHINTKTRGQRGSGLMMMDEKLIFLVWPSDGDLYDFM